MSVADTARATHSDAPPSDVVVQARGVAKKFCKNLRRSMAYGIAGLCRDFVGLPGDGGRLRKGEFWALQDVDFELRRGEVLGLIGPNGSGKSTLLRLLAGILPPDRGEVSVRGRVGALISLGAGFHPHMSGRENIYINGAILGLRRAEVRERFDSIVDFAEMEDFLDAPLSSYSSGMKVRLGFAIAAHVDPALLLVDEVISVGDVFFRHKCMHRIRQMIDDGKAAVFVSHSTDRVRSICDRGLLLDHGRVLAYGDCGPVVDEYLKLVREHEASAGGGVATNRAGSAQLERAAGFPPPYAFEYGAADAAEILNVEVLDEAGGPCDRFPIGETVRIRISAAVKAPVERFGGSFLVRDETGVDLIGTTTHHNGRTLERVEAGERVAFTFSFQNALRPGHYSISAAVNRLADPGQPASARLIHQFDNVAGYRSGGLEDLTVYHRLYVPTDVQIDVAGGGQGGEREER